MNCVSACRRMDSYLENRLSLYERQRLEMHLSSCHGCSEELHRRSAFEQSLLQALGAAVQHRALSRDSSTRIVEAAQAGVRRAIRARRVGISLRVLASVAALSLVVLGVLVWVGRISIPSELGPITLAPVKQLFRAAQQPIAVSPLKEPARQERGKAIPSSDDEPELLLVGGRSLIEPESLKAGESFTVTVYLYSDLYEPVDEARLDLDISGPSGHYQFPLTAEGPLLPHRLTALRLAADDLASPCQEKYLISPPDIFAVPGNYSVRVTLLLQDAEAQK